MFGKKMRLMLVALIAGLFTGIAVSAAQDSETTEPSTIQQTTTPEESKPEPKPCPKVKTHNLLVKKTLRYSERNGDYRYRPASEKRLAKLGSIRACMKKQDVKKYRTMRGAWEKRKVKYDFHKRIDLLTPYGKWAIPEYIVMRESGGDICAKNPSSTAGGYYQFIDSTWYSYGGNGNYGGSHPAACAPAWHQHEVAARAWAGGSGQSHWALTA